MQRAQRRPAAASGGGLEAVGNAVGKLGHLGSCLAGKPLVAVSLPQGAQLLGGAGLHNGG